jgi:hypothetical protein
MVLKCLPSRLLRIVHSIEDNARRMKMRVERSGVSCSKRAATMFRVGRSRFELHSPTRVDANPSSSATAALTAWRWAATMRGSSATSAAMETDFGGEIIKSKNTGRLIDPLPAALSIRVVFCRCVRRWPEVGCRFSQSDRNASRVTAPSRPSKTAPAPIQTPWTREFSA